MRIGRPRTISHKLDEKVKKVLTPKTFCSECKKELRMSFEPDSNVTCGTCVMKRVIAYANRKAEEETKEEKQENKRKVFEPKEVTCTEPGCNNKFIAKSGRQKYCNSCKKKVQMRQAKDRMKKLRKA